MWFIVITLRVVIEQRNCLSAVGVYSSGGDDLTGELAAVGVKLMNWVTRCTHTAVYSVSVGDCGDSQFPHVIRITRMYTLLTSCADDNSREITDIV